MSGFQPEEFKEAVRALWREGLTSGQIADAKGVTRNIVIGVLQRLGEDRRTQGRGVSAKALPKPKVSVEPKREPRRVTNLVPVAQREPNSPPEPRPVSLAPVKISNAIAKGNIGKACEAPKPALMPTGHVSQAGFQVGGSEAAHPPMDAGSVESAPRVAFDGIGPLLPATFLELEKCMCRWPVSEGYYCGARCEPRASYCDFHCDASTNPKYRRPRGAIGERLPIGRSVTASVSRSV